MANSDNTFWSFSMAFMVSDEGCEHDNIQHVRLSVAALAALALDAARPGDATDAELRGKRGEVQLVRDGEPTSKSSSPEPPRLKSASVGPAPSMHLAGQPRAARGAEVGRNTARTQVYAKQHADAHGPQACCMLTGEDVCNQTT
eukprot:10016273-Lingulodinium_polyedra.AAC.1